MYKMLLTVLVAGQISSAFADNVVQDQSLNSGEAALRSKGDVSNPGKERFVFGQSAQDVNGRANTNSSNVTRARQSAFPSQTLKIWDWLDGYKDRAAVVSIANMTSPMSTEPVTQVLGLDHASGLGSYADRDFVGLNVQITSPPALLTTTKTTFTSNTVTVDDMGSARRFLRADQIIDINEQGKSGKSYSGLVTGISGNTVTIDTGWYVKNGNGAKGIPAAGSKAVFVPNTKIWAQNSNVVLYPESQADTFAGYEMGMLNNKIDGYAGYGFDAVNLGKYGVSTGFQSRGKFNIGFYAQKGTNFGFVSENAATVGFYSNADATGVTVQGNKYGVQVKNSTQYSFIQQRDDNSFITGINAEGSWQGLRLSTAPVEIGTQINNFVAVAFVNPKAKNDFVSLPEGTSNAGRTLYIRNLSSSVPLVVKGVFEDSAATINIATKTTVQLVYDGHTWYPLSKYSS